MLEQIGKPSVSTLVIVIYEEWLSTFDQHGQWPRWYGFILKRPDFSVCCGIQWEQFFSYPSSILMEGVPYV